MIMYLFDYEKAVFNSDKLFQSTHLKSSSYKEGTKHARIDTWFILSHQNI